MEPAEEDVALKLLHTADWHLGMRFPSFSEADQLTLMRARMSVLDSIFGLAETNRVDAVLCAGDLFDDPQPDEVWWRGLLERLVRRDWSDRPVFLLPGNHDPLTNTSVWHQSHPFRQALPGWVHVVDRDDFEAPLAGGAVLYAVPCRSTAGRSDLAERIPLRAPSDGRIRIGMLHGQTFDIEGCQTNFPIAKDAAVERGLDYLAIGDTHSFREVPPGAVVPTVYPSAPEPTRFAESDAGHVALVFLPTPIGSGATVRRRPAIVRREKVAYWSWVERMCTSMDELRSLRVAEELRRTVLRLTLDMHVSAHEYDEAQAILRELAGTNASHGRVGVLQVDAERLVLDTTDIESAFADVPEVLQAAVERLRAREHGEDAERAKRALYHLYRLVKEEAS
jgi:DNA repair exonuclease SbcCD nuclease subunit